MSGRRKTLKQRLAEAFKAPARAKQRELAAGEWYAVVERGTVTALFNRLPDAELWADTDFEGRGIRSHVEILKATVKESEEDLAPPTWMKLKRPEPPEMGAPPAAPSATPTIEAMVEFLGLSVCSFKDEGCQFCEASKGRIYAAVWSYEGGEETDYYICEHCLPKKHQDAVEECADMDAMAQAEAASLRGEAAPEPPNTAPPGGMCRE